MLSTQNPLNGLAADMGLTASEYDSLIEFYPKDSVINFFVFLAGTVFKLSEKQILELKQDLILQTKHQNPNDYYKLADNLYTRLVELISSGTFSLSKKEHFIFKFRQEQTNNLKFLVSTNDAMPKFVKEAYKNRLDLNLRNYKRIIDEANIDGSKNKRLMLRLAFIPLQQVENMKKNFLLHDILEQELDKINSNKLTKGIAHTLLSKNLVYSLTKEHNQSALIDSVINSSLLISDYAKKITVKLASLHGVSATRLFPIIETMLIGDLEKQEIRNKLDDPGYLDQMMLLVSQYFDSNEVQANIRSQKILPPPPTPSITKRDTKPVRREIPKLNEDSLLKKFKLEEMIRVILEKNSISNDLKDKIIALVNHNLEVNQEQYFSNPQTIDDKKVKMMKYINLVCVLLTEISKKLGFKKEEITAFFDKMIFYLFDPSIDISKTKYAYNVKLFESLITKDIEKSLKSTFGVTLADDNVQNKLSELIPFYLESKMDYLIRCTVKEFVQFKDQFSLYLSRIMRKIYDEAKANKLDETERQKFYNVVIPTLLTPDTNINKIPNEIFSFNAINPINDDPTLLAHLNHFENKLGKGLMLREEFEENFRQNIGNKRQKIEELKSKALNFATDPEDSTTSMLKTNLKELLEAHKKSLENSKKSRSSYLSLFGKDFYNDKTKTDEKINALQEEIDALDKVKNRLHLNIFVDHLVQNNQITQSRARIMSTAISHLSSTLNKLFESTLKKKLNTYQKNLNQTTIIKKTDNKTVNEVPSTLTATGTSQSLK